MSDATTGYEPTRRQSPASPGEVEYSLPVPADRLCCQETLNTLILNRCIFDIRVTFWFPAFLIGYVMINAPSPRIKLSGPGGRMDTIHFCLMLFFASDVLVI
uniref:Uncharacterized protein n=1 Tax=Escherichia coli TaxID=562 RepID=A0A6G6AJN5_ECOLX|nr:hypothetical protein [Escherichia coli]